MKKSSYAWLEIRTLKIENRRLESAPFGGGRFKVSDDGTVAITDHLGSTRVVFDAAKNVLDRINYYPFGGTWSDASTRYQHTGMENQQEFGLKANDHNARMNFYSSGRFNGIDPLCEQQPGQSPYAYCDNNPVRKIDPLGLVASDYFDEKGRFLYHIDDGTDKRYIVMKPNAETGGSGGVVLIPSEEELAAMDLVFENGEKTFNEWYFRTGDGGTVSRVVEGSTTEVSFEQMKLAIEDITNAGEYAVRDSHLHPLVPDSDGNIVQFSRAIASETDLGNAIGTEANIVQGYNMEFVAKPTKIGDNHSSFREVGFYNKEGIVGKPMYYNNFKRAVKKIRNY